MKYGEGDYFTSRAWPHLGKESVEEVVEKEDVRGGWLREVVEVDGQLAQRPHVMSDIPVVGCAL